MVRVGKVQTSKYFNASFLRSPGSPLGRWYEASNNRSYTACSGSSLLKPQAAALAHLANCLRVQDVEKLAQRNKGRGVPDDEVPQILRTASPQRTKKIKYG